MLSLSKQKQFSGVSVIRAKFIGEDGSMGYRKNRSYLLMTWNYPKHFLGMLFGDYWFVVQGKGKAPCPYESFNAFQRNWEVKLT